MKHLLFLLTFLLLFGCNSKEEGRERISFNNDWYFSLLDNNADASSPDFNFSGWRQLNLPHDWSIESDFSREYPATPGGGALPGGNGWYRKNFHLSEKDKGKTIYIDFDGVYRESKVWINGQLLGYRPNGYVSFRYDMTPYLNYGETENVLVVQADNSKQPNSRWYSGSGIYRNVWLVKTGDVHVDNWGTYITTPVITQEKATVKIETRLKVKKEYKTIRINTNISDASGTFKSGNITISDKEKYEDKPFVLEIEVNNPKLWTLEEPYLYTAVTEVYADGKLTDTYETTFGIRSFRWDPATGFYLNEKPVKILGVCLHHDLGCLGTAVNTRAIERQLEIMKEMGVNSIRTSHNPPAPEVLQLCDRMGLLVQDETFDMWRRRKSRYDYAQFFDEWHEKDITDQILRDRNHASVFMWSIGNEVLEQWTHAHADTLSLAEANLILNAGHKVDAELLKDTTMSVQSLITHTLTALVKRLDTTRVVTAGNNEVSPGNHLFRANALDVYGFNYHEKDFAPFPDRFPGKNLIVSESTSGLMTRGYYEMPSDHIYIRPQSWDRPFRKDTHMCSAYDNCHVPWGTTHEVSWIEVKKYPHVSGLYVWTGFDYLGEPTPYGWPSRSSFFGIVDLAGIPKDVYYMYQSEWTDQPVLHLFPHWNWEEGQEIDLWAYYNNADEVELLVNGKSLGSKRKTEDELHVWWRVTFEPGTITAISRRGGQEIMRKEIQTAGAPAKIVLTADRDQLKADGTDLSFVTVEIQDKDGNLVPDADNLIHFSTTGEGFIAGTDNGNQNDSISLKKPQRNAFFGKAIAVVQNNGQTGTIRLTAQSDGLPDATINLIVR